MQQRPYKPCVLASGCRILNFGFLILIFLLSLLLHGCQANSKCLEPSICFTQPPCFIKNLPISFPDLTRDEYRQDWGKELVIGATFANELDFYRAITGYKRALILIPDRFEARRTQLEYNIMECYFLAGKYREALDTYETSTLLTLIQPDFRAMDDLLLMLYISYKETSQQEKACQILELIRARNTWNAEKLELANAITTGDLRALKCFQENENIGCCISDLMQSYRGAALSVNRAQFLNAVLPGAGYLYVGQKQTALTSFCINALFMAAAYHFFEHGNIAAGIITTSLELGWYIGGINGAGLAAKEYNERVYEVLAKDLMNQEKLFPVLSLRYGF